MWLSVLLFVFVIRMVVFAMRFEEILVCRAIEETCVSYTRLAFRMYKKTNRALKRGFVLNKRRLKNCRKI